MPLVSDSREISDNSELDNGFPLCFHFLPHQRNVFTTGTCVRKERLCVCRVCVCAVQAHTGLSESPVARHFLASTSAVSSQLFIIWRHTDPQQESGPQSLATFQLCPAPGIQYFHGPTPCQLCSLPWPPPTSHCS